MKNVVSILYLLVFAKNRHANAGKVNRHAREDDSYSRSSSNVPRLKSRLYFFQFSPERSVYDDSTSSYPLPERSRDQRLKCCASNDTLQNERMNVTSCPSEVTIETVRKEGVVEREERFSVESSLRDVEVSQASAE